MRCPSPVIISAIMAFTFSIADVAAIQGSSRAMDLWNELENLSLDLPAGEIRWTLSDINYGNPVVWPSNVEMLVQDAIRSSGGTLSEGEIADLREKKLEAMRNSLPASRTRNGQAIVRGDSYLASLTYIHPEGKEFSNWTSLWHQGKGILLEQFGSSGESVTSSADIGNMPPSLTSIRNPYRFISEKISRLASASSIQMSATTEGNTLLTLSEGKPARLYGKVLVAKDTSLPVRIELYGVSEEIRSVTEVEWREISGVWIPLKIKESIFTYEGRLYSEDFITVDEFTAQDVPDSAFHVDLPAGTSVTDHTVSPPLKYLIPSKMSVDDMILSKMNTPIDTQELPDATPTVDAASGNGNEKPTTGTPDIRPESGPVGTHRYGPIVLGSLLAAGGIVCLVLILHKRRRSRE